MIYHLVLALHIIAFVCWFAGLFYLPRLFVYHAMAADAATRETLKKMEYRLCYFIMHPAMLVTLVTGFSLYYMHPIHAYWIHIKIILVFVLMAYQFICGRYLKAFRADRNNKSHRFFRIFNEIPTVLLIVIVLLAILKP